MICDLIHLAFDFEDPLHEIQPAGKKRIAMAGSLIPSAPQTQVVAAPPLIFRRVLTTASSGDDLLRCGGLSHKTKHCCQRNQIKIQ